MVKIIGAVKTIVWRGDSHCQMEMMTSWSNFLGSQSIVFNMMVLLHKYICTESLRFFFYTCKFKSLLVDFNYFFLSKTYSQLNWNKSYLFHCMCDKFFKILDLVIILDSGIDWGSGKSITGKGIIFHK